MRYRWFESISLQRRVCCEPDFLDGLAQVRARPKKKPGFPRLSRQWSAPAYGGAGLKMCVLAQFSESICTPASRETAVFGWRGSY
jgi:hypothetical protein